MMKKLLIPLAFLSLSACNFNASDPWGNPFKSDPNVAPPTLLREHGYEMSTSSVKQDGDGVKFTYFTTKAPPQITINGNLGPIPEATVTCILRDAKTNDLVGGATLTLGFNAGGNVRINDVPDAPKSKLECHI